MLPTLKKLGVLCALTLVILGATSRNAYATHFRYGTISWTVPDPIGHPSTVQFNVQLAFRWSYPWPDDNPNPLLNKLMSADDIPALTITGSGFAQSYPIAMTVVSINSADDWFVGTAVVTATLPAGANVFTASFTSCCRLSTLVDGNHDANFTVWTTVPFTAAGAAMRSSPVSAALPVTRTIVNAPYSSFSQYAFSTGSTLSYRLATTAESGMPITAAPGSPAMTVAPTGVVTWTPTTPGLYAVQTVVTGTDPSGVQSSIVIDRVFDVEPLVGHPPVLKLNGSTTPISITMPPGFSYTVALEGSDPDAGASVTLTSGALPSTATVTPSLPFTQPSGPAVASFEWTPGIADIGSHVIVFAATDEFGNQALNQVTVTVATSAGLYITGTIRDFLPTDLDFAKSNDANIVHFVAPVLDASGKPIFQSGGGPTAPGQFSTWFTRTTGSATYTVGLSNVNSPNPNVYSFSDTNFHPIDGQLLGNAGQSQNNYFTYELHTYYTYNPGDQLTYSSADDLWVFVNGKLVIDLGGVHATPLTATFSPGTMPQLGLTIGQTYRLDIFYAHRGSGHTPAIGLQAETTSICSPLTSETPVALNSLARLGQASLNADGTVRLTSLTSPSLTAGAAWMPTQQLFAGGFSATFRFRITPSAGGAEGLAFVLQNAGLAASGGASGNLGYGGMPKSLAVELDTHQEAAFSDPTFDQVSIHLNAPGGTISASETTSIGSSVASDPAVGAPFNFDDGVPHQVRVVYAPVVDPVNPGGPTGPNLSVYIDEAAAPAAQATLNPAQVFDFFDSFGRTYVGFTTSSDLATAANVDILSFSVASIAVLPAASGPVALPFSQSPGLTGTATWQLRDACNVKIRVGGTATVTATLATTDGYSTPVTVTDNFDGTYRFSYTPLVGGPWSLGVNVNGAPAAASPATFFVSPATPTVTAAGGTYVYNGAPEVATGTAKGVFHEDLGLLTFSYNGASQAIDAATYAVIGSFAGSSHYAAASANATLTITQATPTVAAANTSYAYNGAPHPATGSAKGVLGEDLGALTFTYTPAVATPIHIGSYTASAVFAGNTDYVPGSATGSVTITAAAPTVSVTGGTFTYDGNPHAATGSAAGVAGDTFAPLTFTYNGSSVPPVDAGTYTVVATSAAQGDYAPAQGTATIVINRATPTVTISGGPFTYDATPHSATGTVTGVGGVPLGSAALTYNSNPTLPIDAGSYTVVGAFAGGGNYTSATGSGSLTISPATPTVSVPPSAFDYDGAAHTATASLTGVGGVAISGSPAFTYNGLPSAPVNAGAYSVVATFAAGGNYAAAIGTGSLTISAIAPTVTVTGGTFTYDGNGHGATASVTGLGGVPLGTATFTYNGDAALPVNAGSYTAVATFAAGGNYTSVTATGTLTITPATPTVTITGGPFTYDGGSHAATAAVTGVGGAPLGAATTTFTYNGDAAPPVNVGSYAVVGTVAAGGNYSSATGGGTLTIGPATPTVTVTGGTFVYDGTPHVATAAIAGIGGSPIAGAATFTYNGSSTPAVAAGPYTVVASFVGAGNYGPATGAGTLTVQKATPAVSWVTPSAIMYGTPLSAAQLQATSAVTGTFAYSPSAGYVPGAGAIPLSASFTPVDSSNYNTATAATTLTVGRAPLNITAGSFATVFGAALPPLSATYTGFVNGDSAASLTTPVTLTTTATPASNVGAYPVLASGAASPNYTIAFAPGSATVTRAPLTITADDKTMATGSAVPVLTASYTGFVNGNTASVLSTPVALSTTATSSSPAGSYPIVAKSAVAANYAITFVNGTMTVSPVTSLRTQVQAIRAALAALPRTGNRQDDDHIRDAIADIDQSLAAALWTDGTHLTRRGERFFEENADAVEELMDVSHPVAAVTQAIAQLVVISRQLATIAIGDAGSARGRGAQQALADAANELAQGDRWRGRGESGHAIQEYGEAWHDAQRAMNVDTDHDDHDHDHDRRDKGCRDDR